jgi:mono/diheme cytochrome c family protein
MPIARSDSRRLGAILVALAMAAACAREPAPEATFRIEPPIAAAAGGPEAPLFTVRLDGPEDLLRRLPKQQTAVLDPEYKQKQTYESVSAADLIDAGKPAAVVLADDMRLVFQASDGYRSMTTLATLRKSGGRLAIRDLNAAAGQSWRPIPGKPDMTPAPAYLVWPSDNADLPWPYAVTTIEVWKTEPVDLTRPDADPAAYAGHTVFKKHCSSCHAVNGMGGAVGPELNIPANVTEYWNHTALKQLILNPSSIRRNARMPALGLTDAEADAVVAYLVRMKKLKRAPGGGR